MDNYFAPLELKFTDSAVEGEFVGYGACFSNVDSHGDCIEPGAFAASLAEHKAKGTMPGMYLEHGPFTGGDNLPAGVWLELEEDERGLKGRGKLSALNTDYGRRVHALLRDGAIKGLSIAYRVPQGGAVHGRKPRRMLKQIDLHAVDLVTSPSNALARVEHVKALSGLVNPEKAAASLALAMGIHRDSLSGGNSPNAEQRSQIMQHMQDAHEYLTGMRLPVGMKSAAPTTLRELEEALREMGFSNTLARSVAENGFKSQLPREEGGDQAITAVKSLAQEIGSAFAGFSLPKLK